MSLPTAEKLDAMHHVAVAVEDVRATVEWYRSHFQCRVQYEDETWALLAFENISLAFVSGGRHPPHIGFMRPDAERFGVLQPHRDGTRSVYLHDPAGNAVEILKKED